MNKKIEENSSKQEKIFKIFKYTVYFLLFLNIFYWLREDYLASLQLYPNGVSLEQFPIAFSAFVDTVAWVLLLLMLELETDIISDEIWIAVANWNTVVVTIG